MTATTSAPSVFAPIAASVSFDKTFVPKEFFKTRSGFYVWDGFKDLIVAKAEPIEAGQTFTVNPRVLGRDATDVEIEDELGGQHLFTETQVAAVVAGLIAQQEGGKSGALINDGRANLFYTRSCVVGVGWGAGIRWWSVRTYYRSGVGWHAGDQVFSPATEA